MNGICKEDPKCDKVVGRGKCTYRNIMTFDTTCVIAIESSHICIVNEQMNTVLGCSYTVF